jgi:phage/plasmid-like protein (TIGR03299 family)
MPHEIDVSTGTPAVFTVGRPAWHGLGVNIEAAANSTQAIKLANLDWRVEPWPLHAIDPDGWHVATARDHVANVRTDTRAVLGVVTGKYHVFQNSEAFDFMDSLVGDKLAMYETAGALRGGRKVWMLARIPREYHATPEDVIHPYLLLVNSHDGSTALRMIPTTVRVVCANTLNLAMSRASGASGGEGVTIRHRPSLEGRVREARQKLGIVVARFDRFDDELHAMLARRVGQAELSAYFESLVPAPEGKPDPSGLGERARQHRQRTLDSLADNFEHPSNALRGMRGTAWAAYNAVSQWADHQRAFRGEGRQRDESRLGSVWFGSSHQLKQRAYQAALELARN